ncbi:pseudouridylate synthase 7 homolog [Tetranychus urticae]|uniref:TRUD domain-containing protein n=1 Tax=Tetranychus urticae TaxID=32264 RepID=T1KNE1_TETUR|nr:pseudouridylate synthase 7 homolog [Tetranychus urticae]
MIIPPCVNLCFRRLLFGLAYPSLTVRLNMSSELSPTKGVNKPRESTSGGYSYVPSDHEYAAKRIKLDDDPEYDDYEADFADEECETGLDEATAEHDDLKSEVRSDHLYKAYKVSEKEAFITEFIGDHQGFTGEIKQRYSDFLVHEVDQSGHVVRLTDLTQPIEEQKPVNPAIGAIASILTPELHQKLAELSINKEANQVDIPVDGLQKDERTQIHKYVKERYPGLESNYTDKQGSPVITVMRKGNNARYSAADWPVGKPNFVHFVLYQENHGTIEAIEKISRFTGRQPKAFTYAGTKDKRSISTQKVSSYRQNLDKLFDLNTILGKNVPAIVIGNITFEREPIRLGQTIGNHFDLVIRDLIYNSEDDVHHAFLNIKEKGFINYFGTQRFGMNASPSHSIGLAVLKEDWLTVLDLILSEKKVDNEASRTGQFASFNQCMKIWKETRNPELVLKELSFRNSREARIMKGIIKSGSNNNYYAGFCQITRNQRMLYLHAYQSLLFNKLASFRIQRYGLKVVAGDLLISEKEKCEQLDDLKHIKPRIATENDVTTASIEDVVLPILGVSSILPENEVADKLYELLEADGVTVESFNLKHKELHLSGTYRKLMSKPSNMQMEIVSYDDNTKPLFLTDLDILKGKKLSDGSGDKKALKLSFMLPTSAYATVMLREMMKTDII